VKKRIELAKHMLESNCLTVGEVAELCGFSDVYYFSKVFKGICGIPPSKWK
jgi:YesN/AraC family two-component response regulator